MFCQIKKDVSSSSSDYYYLAGTRGNIPDSCEFCGSGRVDCPECDGSDPNCYYCEVVLMLIVLNVNKIKTL
jgi:hypothetical protein